MNLIALNLLLSLLFSTYVQSLLVTSKSLPITIPSQSNTEDQSYPTPKISTLFKPIHTSQVYPAHKSLLRQIQDTLSSLLFIKKHATGQYFRARKGPTQIQPLLESFHYDTEGNQLTFSQSRTALFKMIRHDLAQSASIIETFKTHPLTDETISIIFALDKFVLRLKLASLFLALLDIQKHTGKLTHYQDLKRNAIISVILIYYKESSLFWEKQYGLFLLGYAGFTHSFKIKCEILDSLMDEIETRVAQFQQFMEQGISDELMDDEEIFMLE